MAAIAPEMTERLGVTAEVGSYTVNMQINLTAGGGPQVEREEPEA